MRCPDKVGIDLKALLNRYNFDRHEQVLIFLRGKFNDRLGDMEMRWKFDSSKIIALLGLSILIPRIEMMHEFMHVLQD